MYNFERIPRKKRGSFHEYDGIFLTSAGSIILSTSMTKKFTMNTAVDIRVDSVNKAIQIIVGSGDFTIKKNQKTSIISCARIKSAKMPVGRYHLIESSDIPQYYIFQQKKNKLDEIIDSL